MNEQAPTDESASSLDLEEPRKRQSVRTTFRLSEQAIQAKQWLAEECWGISQKEVIDELCDLLPALDENLDLFDPELDWSVEGERRTHVLTERAKEALEEVAEKRGLPRDEVLDRALRTTRALVEQQRDEDSYEQPDDLSTDDLEEALELINDLFEAVEETARDLDELLGSRNPVADRVAHALAPLDEVRGELQSLIEDGKPIDLHELRSQF